MEPEEAVDAVLVLISDEATSVTEQTLAVTGGRQEVPT